MTSIGYIINYIGTKCNKKWKPGILNENFQHELLNDDVTTSPGKCVIITNNFRTKKYKNKKLGILDIFSC